MDLRSISSHSRRKEAKLEAARDQMDSAGGPLSRNTPLPSRSFHFPTRMLPLSSRSFHLPRARHSSARNDSTEAPEKCGYQSLGDDTLPEQPRSRQQPSPQSTATPASPDVDEVEHDHANEYAQLSGLGGAGSQHESINVQLVSQPSVTDSLAFIGERVEAEMYGYEIVNECRGDLNRRESRRDRSSRRRSVGHSSVTSLSGASLHSIDVESPEKYGYEDCGNDGNTDTGPARQARSHRPIRRASIGGCAYEDRGSHGNKDTGTARQVRSHRPIRKASIGGCAYEDSANHENKDTDAEPHARPHRPMRRASINGNAYAPSRSASPKPIRRQRRRSIDNRHLHQHPTCLSGRTRTTCSTLAKRRTSLGSVSPDTSTTGTESEASSRLSLHSDEPEHDAHSHSDDDDDDEESFGALDQHFHRSLSDSMTHVLEGLEALDAQLLYGYS